MLNLSYGYHMLYQQIRSRLPLPVPVMRWSCSPLDNVGYADTRNPLALQSIRPLKSIIVVGSVIKFSCHDSRIYEDCEAKIVVRDLQHGLCNRPKAHYWFSPTLQLGVN